MKPVTPTARTRRARLLLVLLALLFMGGTVLAMVLLQSGWRPTRTKNYGELVQPARPIADVELDMLEAPRMRLSELKGKWTLVYFGPAECLRPCTDNLYKMRQITAAQGKEAHRVRRLMVVTDTTALDGLRDTLAEYPGMRVAIGPRGAVRQLAGEFALPVGGPLDNLHRLYIVDPLGNLMMSYPADADPRGIHKDLGLLLKASQIG